MRVADVVEIELPVLMRLIGEILRLAGNRVHLATRSPDFVDYAGFKIAPQLGATGRSPKASIKQQYDKSVLRHHAIQTRSHEHRVGALARLGAYRSWLRCHQTTPQKSWVMSL